MKKWLSVILSASMALSTVSLVHAGEPFSDILDPNYSWAYPSIISMADKGYITGYSDETFRPDNQVTRLEVLALFSRALGAKEKVNSNLIDLAVDMYGDTIAEYKLGWGVEEIAFLMYRGVLSESDLTTYLDGELKDQPMPRYEAAIIITKAMSGEASEEADFADIDEIPENALEYVSFVNEKGIMTGMEGNNFSPMTSVLRSQMAVMLERTCNATEFTFEKVKLVGIDVSGRLLSYVDDEGMTYEVGYAKNVVMNVLGEPVTPKQMTVGVEAVITKSGRSVAFVDTLADTPDVELSGKYVGRATSDGVTSITVLNTLTNEKETYPCVSDVTVTYNNSPATMSSFKSNDFITLKVKAGKVVTVIGETKTQTIANAVIEDINVDDEFSITISHALDEYDGKTLPVSTQATVRKNGKDTDFSEIYPGDTVNLTLEYGVVQSVTSNYTASSTKDGIIEEITISSRPSITVKQNGESNTYSVTNDVKITINGEDATLYDFRVGDSVKITLEGQAVTKITASAAQSTSGEIKGVVTSVNPSYGFIKVAYKTADGYTVDETIYCKDATTKVMTSMGATKKISDIKVDSTVTATGTTSNGAFAAKLIVIAEAN